MTGADHYRLAEELVEHANAAFTEPGQADDDARILAQLAGVHADLAHVAALTGWDTARTTTPGHGPYAEVPVR